MSGSESDDSDIFVIHQKKPVNHLTIQQALKIKQEVLNKGNQESENESEIVVLDDGDVGSRSDNNKTENEDRLPFTDPKKMKTKTHLNDCNNQNAQKKRESGKKNQTNLGNDHVKKAVRCGGKSTITGYMANGNAIEKSIRRKYSEFCDSKDSCENTPQKKSRKSDNSSKAVRSPSSDRKKSPIKAGGTPKGSPKTITDYFSPMKEAIVKSVKEDEGNQRDSVSCKEELAATSIQEEKKLVRKNERSSISCKKELEVESLKNNKKSVKRNILALQSEAVASISEVKGSTERNNLVLHDDAVPSTSNSVSDKTQARESISPKRRKSTAKTPGKSKEVEVDKTVKPNVEGNNIGGSNFYLQAFQTIIHDAMGKLIEFDATGKTDEKLLSNSECDIVTKFFSLSESSQKLYVRLLGRKKCWHRLSKLKYPDISSDIRMELHVLCTAGFAENDLTNEDLTVQLKLLEKAEIQALCRGFRVKMNSDRSKKEDLITKLILESKTLKSVADIFMKKVEVSGRLEKLKDAVGQTAGLCIKLKDEILSVFHRLLLLFSLTHEVDEEEKRWSSQMFMLLEVSTRTRIYPDYKVCPTAIFRTRQDFIRFEEAIAVKSHFEAAILAKDYDEFITCGKKAREEFAKIVRDKPFVNRVAQMDSYLKRYTAGSVYAKILTNYCTQYKKKTDPLDVIEVLNELLDQKIFLNNKRGLWYEELAKAYEASKRPKCAAKLIILSLSDESVSKVQNLRLKMRAQALLKKKTYTIKEEDIRRCLDDEATITVQEPPSVEINGRALNYSCPGSRAIYIQDTENGRSCSTVEEHAILYYKSNGFSEGLHSEGRIVQTIFFILFFDIIYDYSPPGVFQSPYQIAPLDLWSKHFYLNRKKAIDQRLKEMTHWTKEEVENVVATIFQEKRDLLSVVDWKYDPVLYCEIIGCMGMRLVRTICERLVHGLGVVQSGFPDLTLWNPATRKCKFVEVKSPNDKLSAQQRLWLDFLRKAGVDCEVCNVKNVAAKRFRTSET